MGMFIIPIVIGVFIVALFFSIALFLNSPQSTISKRRKEIDKDVLFAGRYLLVKMESGTPLYNSLIDASKGYGIAAKYFKEIVEDIGTGTPIEKSLDIARKYNSSEKFKKILWQLSLAIKTGTDITIPLRATLQAISRDQLGQINAYGKKLNSIMLFYMVAGIVIPSLGMTMLIIIAGVIGFKITTIVLVLVLIVLAFVQAVFVLTIKGLRPSVDL